MPPSLIGLLCLAAALGCSSGPFGLADLAAEFSADRVEGPVDPNVSVDLSEDTPELSVRGFVTHGCSGPAPKGSAILVDTLILVTIRFDVNGTCATVPSYWSYAVRITGLKPGRYSLRVVQPVPDFSIPSNPSAVVFEEIVLVPGGTTTAGRSGSSR